MLFRSNPVDDRDIKLPTDGFRAPTAFEQLIGNMDSNGRNGASRPMPSTNPESPTNPQVGYGDDTLTAPSSATAKADKAEGKPRKSSREAKAATPGFNLN